jgi:murein DD-endopeptidase MepM/ murein hydrolase activator NlpD
LFGMSKKAGLAAGAIVVVVLAASALAGVATAGSGGTGASTGGHKYVNPLRHKRWIAGRIDMGVDYVAKRRTPVVAIGDARIKGADRNSGWPGGHYLWYKLVNGDHRGNYSYVAEERGKMRHAGARVDAGEKIAIAKPGGSGTEWGWASKNGQPRAAPCYSEGMKTNSGKEMNRFLDGLGAEVADKLNDGPDYPSGKRC